MSASWSGERTAFPSSTRKRIMARDPICVLCKVNPSTVADHFPSYMELTLAGVNDPHDERFGRGVCDECHEPLTKQQQRDGIERLKARRTHPMGRRPAPGLID